MTLSTALAGNCRDKNEARILQDIARLLVPSVETLATLGHKRLKHFS
jgi:hypothetical protein